MHYLTKHKNANQSHNLEISPATAPELSPKLPGPAVGHLSKKSLVATRPLEDVLRHQRFQHSLRAQQMIVVLLQPYTSRDLKFYKCKLVALVDPETLECQMRAPSVTLVLHHQSLAPNAQRIVRIPAPNAQRIVRIPVSRNTRGILTSGISGLKSLPPSKVGPCGDATFKGFAETPAPNHFVDSFVFDFAFASDTKLDSPIVQ